YALVGHSERRQYHGETDEKGRIKLSMKALLDRPEAPPQQHHSDEQPHQE
ncbi:MAG: hypothetical protein EB066_03930, partial [Betaproteobacteria bacterium]|nr:hypothetical protein [Betaproteobacteria bacterium]